MGADGRKARAGFGSATVTVTKRARNFNNRERFLMDLGSSYKYGSWRPCCVEITGFGVANKNSPAENLPDTKQSTLVPIRAGRLRSSQHKLAGRFLLDVFHHSLYAGQVSDKLVPSRKGEGNHSAKRGPGPLRGPRGWVSLAIPWEIFRQSRRKRSLRA